MTLPSVCGTHTRSFRARGCYRLELENFEMSISELVKAVHDAAEQLEQHYEEESLSSSDETQLFSAIGHIQRVLIFGSFKA